jgi:hypothetical protein
MATYFVCLDTCVLFDLVQELETGKAPEWWLDLKKLVEADGAKVLVPEVTLLELETCIRELEAKLLLATVKPELDPKAAQFLQNQERLAALMKEHLAHSLDHVAESLKDWRQKRIEGWKAEIQKLDTWLRSGHVIEYTETIGHRTKRRLIASRLPRSEDGSVKGKWQRDQDCAIVESLVWWFEKNKTADAILLFGTNDKKDGGFGQVEDGKGSLDKEKFEKDVGILDETFSKGLPPSQLFHDMAKLVKFATDKEAVKSLSAERAEAVQELKFKQEAEAQVLKQVVARFEMRIAINEPTPGVRRQRLVPGRRSGGVSFGPHWVEDPQGDHIIPVRLIVFQAPEQTTIMDADKPNRAGVGFERVGAFVAENLLVVIPLHGLPVPNFEKWKQEREAEGTVFHPVDTI